MKCPDCGKSNYTKDGFNYEKPRYYCKNCEENYSVKFRSNERPAVLKRQALHLHLEGMSLRAISRYLNESYPNVRNWIKRYDKKLNRIRNEDKITEIQADKIQKHIRKGVNKSKFLLIEVTDKQSKTYIVTDKKKLKKLTKK